MDRDEGYVIRSYEDLIAWRKAMDLVESVYGLADLLPADEKFGLVYQMRRSAVSVPANIAEGQGRRHRKEFLHHLSVARGSLMELETPLILSGRLHHLPSNRLEHVLDSSREVGKILNGLIRALENKGDCPRAGEPCLPEGYGQAISGN